MPERKMYRPHKTPLKYRERGRERYHERMAEMSFEQREQRKKQKAAYSKEWRARTRNTSLGEARRKRAAEKYHQTPDIAKRRAKRHSLLKFYGLTEEQHDQMVIDQSNRCYLCSEVKALEIDHDHDTNKVRKLLCAGCNIGIAGYEKMLRLVGKEKLTEYIKLGRRIA